MSRRASATSLCAELSSYVAAVGLCLTGMLFKWFILYLHLSYLVD